MTDLTARTPIEIDTELARLWGEEADLVAGLTRTEGYLRRARKENLPWEADNIKRYEADIERMAAELVAVRDETNPYTDEFTRRGGWKRYFLVTNTNGHVHRGMHCNTCFRTTTYAWLIDLADCDEGAMIEEWGEKACTVCFPEAPTNPFYNRPARVDREAREARDAEKAARAADKASKAITAPDGGPLKVPAGTYKNYRTGATENSFDTYATKVAASRALSAAIKDFGWYGPTHPNDFAAAIPVLIEALEAAGIDTAPIVARAKKASAKDGAKHIWEGGR